MRRLFSAVSAFDYILYGSSALLLLLGLLMIFSTTLDSGNRLFYRQLVFFGFGVILMWLISVFDYRKLKKSTGILFILINLFLIFVWLFGSQVRGSSRWINLGFFALQPAELAKVIMVIILAKYLDQQGERLKSFWYVVRSAFYIGIPAFLVLVEPDLGSALILLLVWFSMLVFSAMSKKHLLILILVSVVLAGFSWQFFLHDYQKQRIYTFLDPSKDPQGSGYNVIQSTIAVGSGGMWGRGVGRGLQSQLEFLPERQTDFIFASTAEELGMAGSMIVLLMYAVFLYRLVLTAQIARDNFGMYICVGIFFMFFWQTLINIGMNIGIMPVTGIPLPLVSYGGSSLLNSLLAIGLAQSVYSRRKALHFGS
jgi:rod shape determining protein RodA